MDKNLKNETPQNAHPKKAAFLAAYAECGTVTRAAEMAGLRRKTHNDWLAKDPDYVQQFAEAQEQATDRLEQEARRRAVDGLLRMKFYKGNPIMVPSDPKDPNSELIPYVEHEYSDMLITVLLNANNPAKFRRNVDVTSGGKPVVFTLDIGSINADKTE